MSGELSVSTWGDAPRGFPPQRTGEAGGGREAEGVGFAELATSEDVERPQEHPQAREGAGFRDMHRGVWAPFPPKPEIVVITRLTRGCIGQTGKRPVRLSAIGASPYVRFLYGLRLRLGVRTNRPEGFGFTIGPRPDTFLPFLFP